MKSEPRSYLIIPPEPTPNGGLHLGHITGPFLPCDVLARFVRLRGDHAYVITAADSFEPWAVQSARARGITLEEVIRPNLEKMRLDLDAMHIILDDFVLPHEPGTFAELCAEADAVIKVLAEQGTLVDHKETRAFAAETGRSLIGPDLVGRCPACDARVSGSSCEGCGGMWTQENLLDPAAADGSAIKWREINQTSVVLPPISQILDHAERLDLQERLRQTLAVVHERRLGRLSVTVAESEGLTAAFPKEVDRRALYSYFAGLVFARYAGRRHHARLGLPGSAFDEGADTVTVNSLGLDNVVSTFGYIDGVQLSMVGSRPYDRVIVNEFYLLDGAKFSTSRNHLIRPSEMSLQDNYGADALRLYLSLQDLSHPGQSFSLAEFEQWRSDVFATHFIALLSPDVAKGSPAYDAKLEKPFLDAWSRMEGHIDAQRIATPLAAQVLLDWVEGLQPAGVPLPPYALEATAVLAAAFMPEYAQRLWKHSGRSGAPSLDALTVLHDSLRHGPRSLAEVAR